MAMDIVKKYVDEIVTVSNDEIEKAILWLAEKVKIVAEGAGATGLAAILAKKVNVQGKNVALIISGGNIDIDRFINACMNTLKYEHRRVAFNYWNDPKTLPALIKNLQSISGRIFQMNVPEPLTVNTKLARGWNDLILFSPSLKKSQIYFNNLKKQHVRYKLTQKLNCRVGD
jgi:hypothetical protein